MNAPFQPNVSSHSRWATFGPYYAMFPISFARSVIHERSSVGDVVLDPFSGRGTSAFCAVETDRVGVGAEINPLGWIYGSTKLSPATKHLVLKRLADVVGASKTVEAASLDSLPEFFRFCFSEEVLRFLIQGRDTLDWRRSKVDRSLIAFVLVYLHGKVENGRPQALSNQMRQTKAMAPDYSVRWWIRNGCDVPPEIDVEAFLRERIEWRYAKGHPKPKAKQSRILFGDARKVITAKRLLGVPKAKLILTSPPYCGVTSYYYDQWLRFWLLGEPATPTRMGSNWKGKFESIVEYEALLRETFSACRQVTAEDATVYVRTDAREKTLDVTRQVLTGVFPKWRLKEVEAPFLSQTQTQLFGDKTPKPGEIDLILTR